MKYPVIGLRPRIHPGWRALKDNLKTTGMQRLFKTGDKGWYFDARRSAVRDAPEFFQLGDLGWHYDARYSEVEQDV